MSKRLLVNEIRTKLSTLPGVYFQGLFNNQIARESDEIAIDYPAIFLEFNTIDWSAAIGNNHNLQQGAIEFTLHIARKTIDKQDEDFLDVVDSIFAHLDGFTGADDLDGLFAPLRRVSETQDTDYDNVIVWALTFATTLTDMSAANKGGITHTVTTLDARIESDIIIEPDAEGKKIVRTATKQYLEDNA